MRAGVQDQRPWGGHNCETHVSMHYIYIRIYTYTHMNVSVFIHIQTHTHTLEYERLATCPPDEKNCGTSKGSISRAQTLEPL